MDDLEHIIIADADAADLFGAVMTPDPRCPGCQMLASDVDEAADLVADAQRRADAADTRAAIWQGIGLGALGAAGLVAGVLVVLYRLRLGLVVQGDEPDECE